MGKNRKPEDWDRWNEFNRTGRWPVSKSQFNNPYTGKGNDKPEKPGEQGRGTGGVKPKTPKKPKSPKGGAAVEMTPLFELPPEPKKTNPYILNH